MSDRETGPYLVHLLYDTAPTIDREVLLSGLRQRCGTVDRTGDVRATDAFAFLDHRVEYSDGKMPALGFVSAIDHRPEAEKLEAALQQTWDWDEAADAVEACTAQLVVSDFCAPADGATRLALFHGLLTTTLEAAAGARAIMWSPAGRMVDPVAYLASRAADPPDQLAMAVNVRLFNIEDGREDETVMDTLGLGFLGLEDFQCHFVDLDPAKVGGFLLGLARYQFEHGGTIEPGHTVGGPGGERWRVQLEQALVPPERAVLDIEPHGRHSAR